MLFWFTVVSRKVTFAEKTFPRKTFPGKSALWSRPVVNRKALLSAQYLEDRRQWCDLLSLTAAMSYRAAAFPVRIAQWSPVIPRNTTQPVCSDTTIQRFNHFHHIGSWSSQCHVKSYKAVVLNGARIRYAKITYRSTYVRFRMTYAYFSIARLFHSLGIDISVNEIIPTIYLYNTLARYVLWSIAICLSACRPSLSLSVCLSQGGILFLRDDGFSPGDVFCTSVPISASML